LTRARGSRTAIPTVQHRIFESSSKSWEALCDEASAFANEIGRERLINISVAAAGGTDVLGLGARA
jgi:hypothetical protein